MTGPRPATRPTLPAGTRLGLRLRHGGRLARHLTGYAWRGRFWWLLPLVLVLAVVAALAGATHAAVPVAVYTLF